VSAVIDVKRSEVQHAAITLPIIALSRNADITLEVATAFSAVGILFGSVIDAEKKSVSSQYIVSS
jgi:hypothetical protein